MEQHYLSDQGRQDDEFNNLSQISLKQAPTRAGHPVSRGYNMSRRRERAPRNSRAGGYLKRGAGKSRIRRS